MIYYCGNEIKEYKNVTPEYILEYFKDKEYVQVDTETEYNKGKDQMPNPYEHKVLCIQFGDSENQFVVDTSVHSISVFKELIEDDTKVKIFANAFFDLRFFYHYGVHPRNVYDVFLAEMLLTLGKNMEKGYRSLEQMALRYCNVHLNKEIRGKINYLGVEHPDVIKYAAEDVSCMEDIRDKQLEQLKERNQLKSIELENRYVLTLSRMAYNGFKVDSNRWLGVYTNNLEKLSKSKLMLNQWIIDHGHDEYTNKAQGLLLFEDAHHCTINWKSSQQVMPLFKKLGVNVVVRDKKTSKDKDSVDIKILRRQLKKSDLLPIYINYKELEKEIDTYGEDWLKENINSVSGRAHSSFFQLLETGRISSSAPNLQNIPATDEEGGVNPLRGCFVPEEGNILIIADYSQIEPRITAEYSKDPYLIDFIINGDGDSHSLISSAISGYLLGEEIKVSKKNNPIVPKYKQKIRDIGKMINLGLDYGKSAFTVKDDLDCTQEEAQTLIDLIKSKTPKKEEYFKRQEAFVLKHGYIITDSYTNRRAYFSRWEELKELSRIPYNQKSREDISRYYKLKGELYRFSCNVPIQGSSGSMTKLASIIFEDEINKSNLQNVLIVNMVHDEIVIECPEKISTQVKHILEQSMVSAGKYFCNVIPVKVEVYIGKDWGVKS